MQILWVERYFAFNLFSGGHWSESVSSSVTSCMLRGLKPHTTYTFHVWASNDIGDSEPSEQSQFTTAKEGEMKSSLSPFLKKEIHFFPLIKTQNFSQIFTLKYKNFHLDFLCPFSLKRGKMDQSKVKIT